ncbi:PP2C family protein-serine/threonine phosphatase [Streptomyces bohaiensis]|uniref:PP2C family protein-serine/threonine phosphatase n=1 Tax=Streptomyces bohaiensis TaxID=1431344 RepID=UPI003B987109
MPAAGDRPVPAAGAGEAPAPSGTSGAEPGPTAGASGGTAPAATPGSGGNGGGSDHGSGNGPVDPRVPAGGSGQPPGPPAEKPRSGGGENGRDHVERALDGVAGVSDVGLRHHRNEDAFSLSTSVLPDGTPAVIAVVCDGVSSSTRPDEASEAAAEAAGGALATALARGTDGRRAMHDALLAAGEAVNALARQERVPGRNAPACTLVSAVTTGGELTVGWVGDSRAYWLPLEGNAHPIRLTEDDSWAAQMVKAGLMSEEEAMKDRRAHAITAWLGADNPELDPHTASFKPNHPGVVVVCTDGLWNYADSAEEMAAKVPGDARTSPLPSAQQLVRYALDSGGHDNVTVAVIPFPTPGSTAGDRREQAAGRAAVPPTATQYVARPD